MPRTPRRSPPPPLRCPPSAPWFEGRSAWQAPGLTSPLTSLSSVSQTSVFVSILHGLSSNKILFQDAIASISCTFAVTMMMFHNNYVVTKLKESVTYDHILCVRQSGHFPERRWTEVSRSFTWMYFAPVPSRQDGSHPHMLKPFFSNMPIVHDQIQQHTA